jgi:hypothetical protein
MGKDRIQRSDDRRQMLDGRGKRLQAWRHKRSVVSAKEGLKKEHPPAMNSTIGGVNMGM